MFKALQKLQKMFGSRPEDEPDSRLLDGWAHSRGHQLKRVRRGEGRVIEFDCDDRRGRMEWGPSHRAYIKGRELRIRIDAGLPGQMEMMIMSRRLAQQLGGEAYQTLTSAHQTGIDVDLPEEVRWLSMLEEGAGALVGGRLCADVVFAGACAALARWRSAQPCQPRLQSLAR